MPPADDRRLEDLLAAAGRDVQPTHPGWQALPERLARLPQEPPRKRRRWPWAVAAAAAAVLLAAVGLMLLQSPSAQAGPIEVQRLDVELTVLSAADTEGETLYMPLLQRLGRYLTGSFEQAALDLRAQPSGRRATGQALVKDHRLILNLQTGDNVVRFADVAASIDPTSVRFVSDTDPAGTQVVEQNFEYDLADADALLKRYLDKEITCVGRDSQETAGVLVAFDGQNLVLASAPPEPGKARATQSLARATLQAVRLDEVPPDLLTRPTLVWKLRAATPGRHDATLTYLCGLVRWRADYVAVVTPGQGGAPDLLDFTGWVTLDNASGAAYPDAGLKLIAGDVNRVRDPWAVPEPRAWGGGTLDDAGRYKEKREKNKALIEKSFFEYHLYTLTAPSTVRDREIKQLNLLRRSGVPAARRYVFDPQRDSRVAVELVAKNDEAHHLGLPLPKGRVTLEQRDDDGEAAMVGRAEIDHTPVNEEVTLRHGSAFDVAGEFTETAANQFRLRVRNHKGDAIQVRAVARVPLDRALDKASLPFTAHDFQTIYFDFTLPPNAEQVISYTLVPR